MLHIGNLTNLEKLDLNRSAIHDFELTNLLHVGSPGTELEFAL